MITSSSSSGGRSRASRRVDDALDERRRFLRRSPAGVLWSRDPHGTLATSSQLDRPSTGERRLHDIDHRGRGGHSRRTAGRGRCCGRGGGLRARRHTHRRDLEGQPTRYDSVPENELRIQRRRSAARDLTEPLSGRYERQGETGFQLCAAAHAHNSFATIWSAGPSRAWSTSRTPSEYLRRSRCAGSCGQTMPRSLRDVWR